MSNVDPPTTPPEEIAAQPVLETTNEERTLGMLCHLLALFLGFLGPLIIWLIKKDDSPFVDDQGKESLNFQITVLLATIVAIPLCFVVIGFLLWLVISIGDVVFIIIATVKANGGERYRYPICLRLVK